MCASLSLKSYMCASLGGAGAVDGVCAGKYGGECFCGTAVGCYF